MMEKVKTVALAVLVGASLFQSYLLSISNPGLDFMTPAPENYVEAELTGTPLELQNLVYPGSIVLHFGGAKHTVLHPKTTFYEMVYDKVKQRTFDGFARVSDPALRWEEYRNQYQGVEIRFRDGVSVDVLQRIMQLKGEMAASMDPITRIWMLTKDNKEDFRTLFISDTSGSVYEATRADITAKDVEGLVGLGAFLTPYKTADGRTYLPEQPLSMVQYRYAYEEITSDQLRRSLFPDPASTRSLMERDGSQIFTDGKRGLQIRQDQKWMGFSDPAASIDDRNNIRENLMSSIQFVNQHGGWSGSYIAYRMPQRPGIGSQTFVFRKYIGGYTGAYPVVSERSESFGYVKLSVQRGVVTEYERSLLRLKHEVAKEERSVPGGAELEALLARYEKRSMIVSIFPAYRAVVMKDIIEFRPTWAVELFNGTFDLLGM